MGSVATSYGVYNSSKKNASKDVPCEPTFSALKYRIVFPRRYNVNLKEAKKNGIKKGLFVGGSLGFVFFLQFCAFSLAFWYGAKLVREQPENYDGGNIITVSSNDYILFLMLNWS